MTEEMQARQPSRWVRFQVGSLTLILLGLVGYRFFTSTPPANLDAWSLVILLLVTILILSEAFDNFSIGRILSISREVKKKEKEVEKLETANDRLFSQLMSFTANQSQAMTHTNVYGDYHAGRIEPATPQEVLESREKEAEESRATQQTAGGKGDDKPVQQRRLLNFSKVDEFGLQEYIRARNIDRQALIRDAKLVSEFHDIDGISNNSILFDGYIKGAGEDIFVEIRPYSSSPTARDRIYMMLSKIKHYGQRNNRSVRMDLVLIRLPSRDDLPFNMDRVIRDFEPAISNGLLSVVTIDTSKDEEEELFTEGR